MFYTKILEVYDYTGWSALREDDCPEWLKGPLSKRDIVKVKKHNIEMLAFGIDGALQWVKPGGHIALREDGSVTPISDKSYKAYCKRRESKKESSESGCL